MTQRKTIAALAGLVAVSMLVSGVAMGATPSVFAQTQNQDQPTISVSDATVETGATTTVTVAMQNAPNGLSGYDVTLSVDDPGTATIVNATYPNAFGLTDTPAVGDNGAGVALRAVDVEQQIQPGASDVVLATVELEGVQAGETSLTITDFNIDDENGSDITPTVTAGTVTVQGDGTATTTPAQTQTPSDDDADDADDDDADDNGTATTASTDDDADDNGAAASGNGKAKQDDDGDDDDDGSGDEDDHGDDDS